MKNEHSIKFYQSSSRGPSHKVMISFQNGWYGRNGMNIDQWGVLITGTARLVFYYIPVNKPLASRGFRIYQVNENIF